MSLPKIAVPTFHLIVPTTGQAIEVRPFLVKEEKAMLIAAESGEAKNKYTTMKNIITACVQKPANFDVNMLTPYDFEFLMLRLRAISISNEVTLKFRNKETEEVFEFTIDLNTIEPVKFNKKAAKINITEDGSIGLVMRLPTLADVEVLVETDPSFTGGKKGNKISVANMTFKLISLFVDSVWNGDQVIFFKDVTQKERDEFIDSLPRNVFIQMKEFLDSAPQLTYTHHYKDKEGNEKTITLRGYEDFF